MSYLKIRTGEVALGVDKVTRVKDERRRVKHLGAELTLLIVASIMENKFVLF